MAASKDWRGTDWQESAIPRVILVTDPAFSDEVIVRCVEQVGSALPAGWLSVQLRDKRRPGVSLRVFASRLRGVTRAVGARLVMNGHPGLARDVGADGVHLGGDGGPVSEVRATCGRGIWVSVAAHSEGDVRAAVEGGADAVLVSPIFSTRPPSALSTGKEGRGLRALSSARALSEGRLSIYALGGVTEQRARACIQAGAHGVAVMRALLASPDPSRVARALRRSLA